jgi:AraC-like DNA-binding protein
MSSHFTVTTSNLRYQTRLACGLIPLLNLLQDHGVDINAMLRDIKLHTFELFDPAFTISLEQELTIVETALDYIDQPGASLALARRYHLHNFSMLGLAIRSCATLGEVFELIIRFPRLVWGICETTGSIDHSSLRFELRSGPSRTERFLLERDLACIKTLFSEVLNSELQLSSVWFSYPAPQQPDDYIRFFNCPVTFGQATSGLIIPLAEIARPVPTADPLSREFYEAQCARMSADMDEPFRYAYSIRDHLSRMTPIPSLEQLAVKLDIEPRTLQRQLKKEAATFSAILREVRLKRALDRLRYSTYNAEQIALELGFNDAVAFSHAFKQWTGLAPGQWRETHQPSTPSG